MQHSQIPSIPEARPVTFLLINFKRLILIISTSEISRKESVVSVSLRASIFLLTSSPQRIGVGLASFHLPGVGRPRNS